MGIKQMMVGANIVRTEVFKQVRELVREDMAAGKVTEENIEAYIKNAIAGVRSQGKAMALLRTGGVTLPRLEEEIRKVLTEALESRKSENT